jgi:hypothetical protein
MACTEQLYHLSSLHNRLSLLISQNDVTGRAQLEAKLQDLAEMQVNMLAQVHPCRHLKPKGCFGTRFIGCGPAETDGLNQSAFLRQLMAAT